MRVLHVVESFAAGVLSIVEQLANGARQRGADVHVAFSRRFETPTDFADGFDVDVHFHEIDLSRGLNPKQDVAGIVKIYHLIRRLKPDIIHLHSSKAGFLGRLAWRLGRLMGEEGRLFYSPHGFSFLQKNLGKVERLTYLSLEKIAYHCGGIVVGCSRGETEIARDKLGIRRVAAIENAVSENDLPQRKIQRGRSLRIVTAGRISHQKHPALFARLAVALAGKDVKFVWVGTTAQGQESLVHVLYGHVKVTGWLSREAALQEIAASDIYLQTSRWEGMPVSVIEAMMMGLPAVVSDVVGNRDIVAHGSTGYVFAHEKDAETYLKALIRDADMRIEMGRRAATEARRRFSNERFLSEWARLYGLASAREIIESGIEDCDPKHRTL